MAKYDIAISFAGEQRELAESIATRLDAVGYSVFYDRFERAELWGQDLSLALGNVYENDAKFCLILVSEDYVKKAWTNLERQNAISRFMREHHNYILCLKTDASELPGLPSVIGYISLSNTSQDEVHEMLLEKLGRPKHDDFISKLSSEDQEIAKEILEASYRRAIYTRMASEISMKAMNESLGNCLGRLQKLTPRIADPAFQLSVTKIVAALDEIERLASSTNGEISCNLPKRTQIRIDNLKLEIIRRLLEIRRAAGIVMQLPYNLIIDHFFSVDEANMEPQLAR